MDDITINENFDFQTKEISSNSEGLNSKNVDLESSETKENEINNQYDDIWFEIDEDEEENFEDAIDEILTQSVIECINENAPSTSSGISDSNENRQNIVQKILERQRNELALELRRLRFETKPLETRSQLENIFNNMTNTPVMNSTNTSSNISSTHVPVSYRSENILSEISQLSSRRIVSNIEDSFRESIERNLRQRVNPVPVRMPVLPEIPSTENRQFVPRTEIREPSIGSEPNNLPNLSVNSQVEPRETTEPTNRRNQTGQPLPYLLTPSSGNNPSEDATREEIINEISSLLSRNLVSSTLESNFRTILENNIRDRIRRTGIDGNRTRHNLREFMRSRGTSNTIQRNDFSHLGINNQQDLNDLDNLDSASSHSGHRYRTVIHQNNSREIRDLKNELSEMKSMLKLSFEMQLDMQKSFKQEISALIAGTFQDTASANLINSSRPNQDGKCIICTDSDCDTVFYKCGHMVSCYMCSLNLKNKGHNCPVCRAPIVDILRTFKSSFN